MKRTSGHVVVLVTAPGVRVARALARGCVGERLAACAQLLCGLESHYWWKGRMERSREVLVLFKTRRSALPELERAILRQHPYETPQIVAVRLETGTPGYLDWLDACVPAPGKSRRRASRALPRPVGARPT